MPGDASLGFEMFSFKVLRLPTLRLKLYIGERLHKSHKSSDQLGVYLRKTPHRFLVYFPFFPGVVGRSAYFSRHQLFTKKIKISKEPSHL